MLRFFSLIKLIRYTETKNNDDETMITSTNFTIINTVLCWFGPLHEGKLAAILITIQVRYLNSSNWKESFSICLCFRLFSAVYWHFLFAIILWDSSMINKDDELEYNLITTRSNETTIEFVSEGRRKFCRSIPWNNDRFSRFLSLVLNVHKRVELVHFESDRSYRKTNMDEKLTRASTSPDSSSAFQSSRNISFSNVFI